MAGRGSLAPGAIVIRHLAHNDMHPYVVHFANTQYGGYHGGEYCETLSDARLAYAERVKRADRDGDLHRAFLRP